MPARTDSSPSCVDQGVGQPDHVVQARRILQPGQLRLGTQILAGVRQPVEAASGSWRIAASRSRHLLAVSDRRNAVQAEYDRLWRRWLVPWHTEIRPGGWQTLGRKKLTQINFGRRHCDFEVVDNLGRGAIRNSCAVGFSRARQYGPSGDRGAGAVCLPAKGACNRQTRAIKIPGRALLPEPCQGLVRAHQ